MIPDAWVLLDPSNGRHRRNIYDSRLEQLYGRNQWHDNFIVTMVEKLNCSFIKNFSYFIVIAAVKKLKRSFLKKFYKIIDLFIYELS